MDYVGFALVSGGEHNGQYVDKNNNFFRLQDGKMIAVESGAAVHAVGLEQEGKLIGAIKPIKLDLPGGKGVEAAPSVDKLAAEAAGEGDAVAPLQSKESEEIEIEAEEAPMQDLGEAERVNALLADFTPHEIRALICAARNKGIDIVPLEGDDEMTTRKNAQALARVME